MVGGAAVKRSESAQCEGLSSPVGREWPGVAYVGALWLLYGWQMSFAKGRKRYILGRQGAGGAERMAKAVPISGPLNGQLIYLSEKSGSGPMLLSTLQGWSYGVFFPEKIFELRGEKILFFCFLSPILYDKVVILFHVRLCFAWCLNPAEAWQICLCAW